MELKLKNDEKEVEIPVFRFDPIKHRYYLGEKQLTGVTTILGVLAKPALIQWAANEAVEYITEKALYFESTNDWKVSGDILVEARTAHVRKRDKSADIGTVAHSWISDYIGGKNPERNEEIAIITNNFLKWVEEAKPKFLASEKVVYSKQHWFAGTLDFIAEIDGKVYLGDVKTGSGIYQEMFWQTSGYQLALEEIEPEWKIEGHIIVNPTKEGKLNVESNFFYPENVKGFLAALQIYRIINKYEG